MFWFAVCDEEALREPKLEKKDKTLTSSTETTQQELSLVLVSIRFFFVVENIWDVQRLRSRFDCCGGNFKLLVRVLVVWRTETCTITD